MHAPGLDCEQHKWAINHGPRRMITDNLARAGMREGCWLAEISVRDGEKLAGKTLNPLLGVVGGISILGTSGIVRPYSHEAYIATIRICVRSTRLSRLQEGRVLHRGPHRRAGEDPPAGIPLHFLHLHWGFHCGKPPERR